MKFTWYSVCYSIVSILCVILLSILVFKAGKTLHIIALIVCSVLSVASLMLTFLDARWKKKKEKQALSEKSEE